MLCCVVLCVLLLLLCRLIPKDPPASDWRVLLHIVKADPTKAFYMVRGGTAV